MPEMVVSQSTIKLTPGVGWSWHKWDGVVTLNQPSHSVSASGADLVLEPDVVASIAQQSAGKAYVATGFSDAQGAVGSVVASAEQGTLAQTVQVESMKPVIRTTEGTFVMTVGVPSMKIPPSGTPVPDPMVVKKGTWKIEDADQGKVTAK